MVHRASWPFLIALLGTLACTVSAAKEKYQEIAEPEQAKADPDFDVQGEYVGEVTFPNGKVEKGAAQVIARGDGRFEVVLYKGGLPGDGWKPGDDQIRTTAEPTEAGLELQLDDIDAKIAGGKMTLVHKDGKIRAELARVVRTSPTLAAEPPEGAVVLFDGTGPGYFPGAKLTGSKNLLSGIASKQEFFSYSLHLEFRLTWMPKALGQRRSNSGVYVHNCYEIQVLDSFGLSGEHNECGGVYSMKKPDVNMCLPPLEWQTYDIDFTAPKYDEAGKKVANARLSVRHNGVVIHDNFELTKDCPGDQPEGPGPRGLSLQGHGCHVQYRNIWLVPKE